MLYARLFIDLHERAAERILRPARIRQHAIEDLANGPRQDSDVINAARGADDAVRLARARLQAASRTARWWSVRQYRIHRRK